MSKLPRLRLVNTPCEIRESGVRWLCKSTANKVAVEYRQSGRRLLAVDGFMGSGKSTLARLLADALRCDVLSLDETLPADPHDQTLGYVELLDENRVSAALNKLAAAGEGIVEGVCLRTVLAKHDVLPGDVFHVYTASVSVPTGNVLWHEAALIDLEELPPDRLYREVAIYHRDWQPHAGADAIVIRSDDDELLEFRDPTGQQFALRATLWRAAGIGLWLPPARCYVSASPDAPIESLASIRPPVLSAETRGLDDGRLLDILTKIRRETPLDPVKVYRELGTGELVLQNGAHRYFASVALCCTHIPCEYVDAPPIL